MISIKCQLKSTIIQLSTKYFCKRIKSTENKTIISSTSTTSIITAIITHTQTTMESTNKPNYITEIGCCLDQKVSDELKYKLITNVWVPNKNFTFSISENRNLKFQLCWIKRFLWLFYTKMQSSGVV